jgi:LacI family transcriptional regulator
MSRGSVERRSTLKDVARVAGVHVSVVSKVLNGSQGLNVRPDTRARIIAASEDLRYRPNSAARALRSASTGALGMLVPSLRNPVYAEIIRGAFDRAWERNFVVVLAEDRTGGQAEEAYQRLVEDGRIDGLLASGVQPESALAKGSPGRVPLVFVNRRHPGGTSVSMREEEAASLAVGHLRALGHRRIAHLAGPQNVDTAKRRVVGYERALDARVRPIIVHASFDEPAGYAAMTSLISANPRPTAVFVSNINQAIGALASARDAGLEVPRDISVIAYDDDPIGNFLDPPLTAILMPLRELGRMSVDVLLDGTPDGATDVTVPTPPQLIIRASTGSV